ncbi:hypothetical protein KM043_009922 [Ampulex compressa]|nr:hypothetical protein KM043_009922 [Ampulex compressa]
MDQNPEEYPNALSRNESENESNDEEYARSPVLLDLDENSKQQQQQQQQQEIAQQETNSSNSLPTVEQHLQDQLARTATEDSSGARRQSLRRRWQDANFEDRQQNSDGVLVIRVPEPEIIGSHPHLEILHETNIKSVQREPSQTEKGAPISNCTSPATAGGNIALRNALRVLFQKRDESWLFYLRFLFVYSLKLLD